jgi:MFS superfamily sulfate permease-like transporter
VESLRSCGAITPDCPDGNYNWFFPAIGSHDFTLPYRNYDPAAVRWDAVLSLNVLPVLIVMVIIVNIDVLLKLAGTEKQLAVSLDMNREMIVAGVSNFFNALVFGPPGYGQTKFSVLNFAIVRDAKNRLPGFVCGLFNAAMFLSGFPLINYLPRFFLAGLLIFAGAGFIVENLFDARSTLSPAVRDDLLLRTAAVRSIYRLLCLNKHSCID